VKARTSIIDAVISAVYIAGLSADIAEQKFGKRVMTASDTAESLADSFRLFDA